MKDQLKYQFVSTLDNGLGMIYILYYGYNLTGV